MIMDLNSFITSLKLLSTLSKENEIKNTSMLDSIVNGDV